METHHRFRQVHLDFHTASQCQNIGTDFSPQTFIDTLKTGHVNAINIFARCHHGYSYYPTKVGTIHPNLSFDLLGKQIEALHAANIVCPIYMTIKWDDLAGSMHPEWVCVNKKGEMVMRHPLSSEWGWTTMDVSTAYSDYVAAQVEELFTMYGDAIDGLWFDICFPVPNYSPWGQSQMVNAGINLEDDAAVWRFARRQDLKFFERISRLVRSKSSRATIFFNGTVTPDMAEMLPYLTHFEVESLPTSGDTWGYLHYPVMSRMARTFGKEFIGMTGRFHRSWSDFGGLKTTDQLDYECATILAAGGKICVGDQLHPCGTLDAGVYRLIGRSFEKVEKLEPWLYGAVPAAEAAILALGSPGSAHSGVGSLNLDVEGAAQVLLESGIQFDIVEYHTDLHKYALVILPDTAKLNPDWTAILQNYLDSGGKLVLSGTAALDPITRQFTLEDIPVEFTAETPTVPSYLHLDQNLSAEGELADDYDYVFYGQSYLVKPKPGTQAKGEIHRALFTRSWEHYTGHQHAPFGDSMNTPISVQNDRVLYFSAPLFTGYRNYDYWAYRAIIISALRQFMQTQRLIPGGPGWVEFTLQTQPAGEDHPERQIVYVIAYHPRRSSQAVPHVDQAWPTSGLSFKLRLDGKKPQKVYLAPERKDLQFTIENGYLHVDLPPVRVSAVVVIE